MKTKTTIEHPSARPVDLSDLFGITAPLYCPAIEIVTVKEVEGWAIHCSDGLGVPANVMPGAVVGDRWLLINEMDDINGLGRIVASWRLSKQQR